MRGISVKNFFQRFSLQSRIIFAIAGAGILIIGVFFAVAYEPVTRNFVAQDATCNYCHLPWEFNPDVRLTATKPHQAKPDQPQSQAKCVDCHLPEGRLNATFVYTHIVSFTDLFGKFRDLEAERAGDWIPPRAATAYRVRDRLFETDSGTCRTCHIEDEIKPKRTRGINAHKLALEKKQTCIECHYNEVHRPVDQRKAAFQRPIISFEQPPSAEMKLLQFVQEVRR